MLNPNLPNVTADQLGNCMQAKHEHALPSLSLGQVISTFARSCTNMHQLHMNAEDLHESTIDSTHEHALPRLAPLPLILYTTQSDFAYLARNPFRSAHCK